MKIIEHVVTAAGMKKWPLVREANGDVKVEIPTHSGRTQVVTVNMGKDSDGDIAALIWSKAGDTATAQFDPWELLRLNARLSYGRAALRGNDIIILHNLYDEDAQLAEVGKTLYWVAHSADVLEQGAYGSDKL
jgi:hypothetical protein